MNIETKYATIDRDELKRLQRSDVVISAKDTRIDELVNILSELRHALKNTYQASPEGRAYLDRIVAVLEGEQKIEFVNCACGDSYPSDSWDAGFMAANNDVCVNCDAAQAATPSEDGGEVPEVVANFDGRYLTPLVTMEKGSELMTVAQHERITKQLREEAATAKARQDHAEMVGDDLSRIVAAKDAALVELINSRNCYQWEFERVSAEFDQLRVQPARQGGVDERECLDCNGTGESFGSFGCAECEGTGRVKVALAPAAVAKLESVMQRLPVVAPKLWNDILELRALLGKS